MIKFKHSLSVIISLLMFGSAMARSPDPTVMGNSDPVDAGITMPSHAQLVRFLLQPVDDPSQLRGYRVAIVAADGVDGFDLEVPRFFLSDRGASVHIIIPRSAYVVKAAGSGAVIRPKTQIHVLEPSGETDTASFDHYIDQVQAQDYDVVYLPGRPGDANHLVEPGVIAFLREAESLGKPIFAAGDSAGAIRKIGALDEFTYSSQDAYDMPVLINRLIATLLTRPATVTQ